MTPQETTALTMRVLRIERLLRKNIVELVTNVRPANRGTAISVESYERYHAYPLDVERDIEHTKDFIEDVCEGKLNKFLFKRLRDEYDYRSSRETIIETIKANQYYFTEKGNIDNDKG